MKISNGYVAVSKIIEPKTDADSFETVEVQDSSLFKGKVEHLPAEPVFMGNDQVAIGDIIYFAKYSPDTHDLKVEGEDLKFVSTRDILAVK